MKMKENNDVRIKRNVWMPLCCLSIVVGIVVVLAGCRNNSDESVSVNRMTEEDFTKSSTTENELSEKKRKKIHGIIERSWYQKIWKYVNWKMWN